MSEENEVPASRAAVVTAGVVENVILVAAPQEDEEAFELEGSEIILLTQGVPVDVGWLWDGEGFQPPDEGE